MSALKLEWFAKPFGPGDMDGQGARRLLGQPSVSRLAMLVRETAQNSWDARRANVPVHFQLHLRTLSPDEQEALRSRILPNNPPGIEMATALEAGSVTVLEISDRGTAGLAGPIRNDLPVASGVPTDFIDLVFTTGSPRDKHLGGGTYGFGKTIAYLVSRVGTILIHSRTAQQDEPRARFIASAMGTHFDLGGRRYTGRHWWGVLPESGRVEPLTGDAADHLAAQVFADIPLTGSSGTSIMIVAPDFEGLSLEAASTALSESVLWHLWPKLMPTPDRPAPMTFELLVDGVPVDIPDPRTHPILKGHAEALNAVRAVQAGHDRPSGTYHTTVREIRSLRPQKLLGHLALTRYDAPVLSSTSDSEEESETPISGVSHHVTLMRHQAELVVKYLERQPFPSDLLQWAAVFKPVEQVDDSFAVSEPPAHDDWVPDAVPRKEMRRDVRVALTRIREAVAQELRPADSAASGEAGPSAAKLADSLAGFVMSARGSRPTASRPGEERGDSKPRRLTATFIERRAEKAEGWVRHEILFEILIGSAEPVQVWPTAAVAYDGGREKDHTACRVLGFRPEADGATAAVLTLQPGESGRWWVIAEAHPDLAIDVDLVAETADPPR
jgi:hypothetical protein